MDFPQAEYETRLTLAQQAMAAAGMDALFINTEAEFRYFSGFRSLFWQSPTRPWYLILPRRGDPIAVVPEIGAPVLARGWIRDIRPWPSPAEHDDGVSLLADAMSEFATIGMAMGRESHLRMPLNDFHALPCKNFVDASPLLAALRFVKSPAEIALHAKICTIASDAFDRVPHILRAGMAMETLFRHFKIALLEAGAEDVPYLVGGRGPLGYDDVISPPDNTPIQGGDVVMMDTGATLKGTFCDFDRNFALGYAADAVKRTHETLWRATEAGLAAARPGATCADLFHAMANVIGDGGGNVGRMGHGLGLQLTETPSIIHWDRTVLREGAVITLEPSMAVKGGGMLVHEENIVITDGPPRLLTRRAPRELPIIAIN
ncbi:MAG: Xaa-Pro peptidase family protein [Pseudomonadota bacterium]